jgi:hypothetical protein
VWVGRAEDGSARDADGVRDATTAVRAGDLEPLVPGTQPREFLPGGVIASIDEHLLEGLVATVDDLMGRSR